MSGKRRKGTIIPNYYEFLNSVKINAGHHALETIPHELNSLGATRPMLLTNGELVKYGLVKHVVEALKETNITLGALYRDIPADSSVRVVNEVARIFRKNGCDSLIAVGGGSVIDTAKGVNIVVSEAADDLLKLAGAGVLTKRQQPLIVIPTTAGTGSEATQVAVIKDTDRNVKLEFVSHQLLPDVALLDPRMTISLPPRITASTGMDALAHAVEAYTSLQKNPLSDAYAIAAINLIRTNLPAAVKKGQDVNARLAMSNASLMAGIAFSNAMVGIVHAVGHACGGISGVPHGDAMGILLPHGMEYNLARVGGLYGELLLPLAGAEKYASTPPDLRGAASVIAVREMALQYNGLCDLPLSLRAAGVQREELPLIARAAIDDGAVMMNREAVEYEDVLALLEQAY